MLVGAVHSAGQARESVRIIGEGAEATVRLDDSRGVVTKAYKPRDGGGNRRDAALREYRILVRFERALRVVPGVTCPAPLALDQDLPGVSMRYVDGARLHDYVARTRLTDAELRRVALGLAKGLCTYLSVVHEPYYDFCLHNALFQPAESRVVLLDFGIPRWQPPLHGHYADVELSVGNLLGCVLYELVRPARVCSGLAQRQLVAVYCALRDQLLREGALRAADLRGVEEVARFTYRRLTHPSPGPALRRAWYRAWPVLDATRLARAKRVMFAR